MWELLVEESIRREAATCSGELIVQLCATIFVQTGSQAFVRYQKFEYAIGHWLQKATEHMLGCVLCR